MAPRKTRANSHRSSWAKDWDCDANRLPYGTERIGYDADTQEYIFQDTKTGKEYRGRAGQAFGDLREVKPIDHSRMYAKPSPPSDDDQLPAYELKQSRPGTCTDNDTFPCFVLPTSQACPPAYATEAELIEARERFANTPERCTYRPDWPKWQNNCHCTFCRQRDIDHPEGSAAVIKAVNEFRRRASSSVRVGAATILRRGTLVSAALKYKALEKVQDVDESK